MTCESATMSQPHKTAARRATLFLVCLLVLYALPLVVYVAAFGTSLSDQHPRWAEFGSAMSGIYAPIIALTTLAVLVAQVGLQKQINEHQFEQSYLQQARADLEFYTLQLANALQTQMLPGQNLRQFLHKNFQPSTAGELDAPELRTLAANADAILPSSLGLWFAVYPILTGLAAGKGKSFDMTLASAKQKLIAILSYETCVSLDNYHRTRSEGRLNNAYAFSPLLS